MRARPVVNRPGLPSVADEPARLKDPEDKPFLMRSPLRNLISRISDACGSPLARVSLVYPNMNEILTDVLVGAAFVEAAVMACLLFELIYELPL
jgi:hypothetical protein